MKIQLVRIGNSRGIRIPEPFIEQCGLGDTVDMRVEQGQLVIAPERAPRRGWKKAFAAAGASGRDSMLLKGPPANEFDVEDWIW